MEPYINPALSTSQSVPTETSQESPPLLQQPAGGGDQEMGQSKEVFHLGSPANPRQPSPENSERASIGQPQRQDAGNADPHRFDRAQKKRCRKDAEMPTWVERKYNGFLTMTINGRL